MSGWSGKMKTRFDIINFLIEENKYEKYLEIGEIIEQLMFNH